MERIGRITSAALVLAFAAIIITLSNLFAQVSGNYQSEVGSSGSCKEAGMSTAEIDGNSYDVAYESHATFETVSNSDDPTSTTLKAVAFTATGEHPELGTVSWTLYPSTVQSTITANQAESDFPATSRLFFYAEITVSSQPGAVYRSDEALEMVNHNLTEWPHNNAEYSQEKAVSFTNINDPTQTLSITGMTGRVSAE